VYNIFRTLGAEYIRLRLENSSLVKYSLLGKYMWLTKAHTSQEAPTSTSGSSSLSSI